MDAAQASRLCMQSDEQEQPEVLRQLHALAVMTNAEPQQVPDLILR